MIESSAQPVNGRARQNRDDNLVGVQLAAQVVADGIERLWLDCEHDDIGACNSFEIGRRHGDAVALRELDAALGHRFRAGDLVRRDHLSVQERRQNGLAHDATTDKRDLLTM